MHAPQHDHVLQLHDYLFVLFQHFVGNVGIVEFGYIGHREQYIAFDVLQRPTGIQIIQIFHIPSNIFLIQPFNRGSNFRANVRILF